MKKMIEKPEIKVLKFEAMDVIATSSIPVESTGVTMSTSRGFVVTGSSYE